MPLYKLTNTSKDLNTGVLERARHEDIDYEKYFESWLENSPDTLLDDEGTVLWIGRQVTAEVGDIGKFPDLLGIDASGDLVIVELKKGRTPRNVVAQILEYASWATMLDYDQLNDIAQEYFAQHQKEALSLREAFKEVFSPDEDESSPIEFNSTQRLFIVAEEISPIIRQVTAHLRSKYQMSIFCVEYEVLRSDQGDYFISTERIGGYEDVGIAIKKKSVKASTQSRWTGNIKVKDVVYNAVKTVTKGDGTSTFSPADVNREILREYPDFNTSTTNCQLIQDCVNHTSRRHYPSGQQNLYFWLSKGKYRLYAAEKDGKWNYKGERTNPTST